jgi:hypothetical protein
MQLPECEQTESCVLAGAMLLLLAAMGATAAADCV